MADQIMKTLIRSLNYTTNTKSQEILSFLTINGRSLKKTSRDFVISEDINVT